jgi:hypothetical protein
MAFSHKHQGLKDIPFERKEIDVHQVERANRLDFLSEKWRYRFFGNKKLKNQSFQFLMSLRRMHPIAQGADSRDQKNEQYSKLSSLHGPCLGPCRRRFSERSDSPFLAQRVL